jgi:PKD repeat protein
MKKYFFISALSFGILLLNGCKKDPPVALFSIDKTTYKVDDKLTFTNLSENAKSYVWDFGDGKTSTAENPTHTYLTPGDVTIKLIATGGGGTDSISNTITVLANLTGIWYKTLTISSEGGFKVSGTMDIEQHDDNSLTGSFAYAEGAGYFTLSPASKIVGNTVTIVWQQISYEFQGTVSADGKTMAGTFLADSAPAGTWTAKKL